MPNEPIKPGPEVTSGIALDRVHVAITLLLAGMALVVRWIAAQSAHPACGDALHFIEYGWRFAQGDLAGLSSYWSQGQILMAALAFKAGWDPQLTLQAVTMITGTLSAPLLFLLALRLDAGRVGAVAAGLIIAVNPFLVNMSITGYSEVPYLASWLWGCVFLLHPLRGGIGWVTAILAGVGFGLSLYFRMTDALILAAMVIGFHAVVALAHQNNHLKVIVLRLSVVALTVVILLSPLAYHSWLMSGTFMPTSSKVQTIVIGDDAYDSRWMYGVDVEYPWESQAVEYEQKGLIGYLWNHRDDVIRRVSGNLATIVRLSAGNLLTGPLRMGPAAFGVIMMGCLLALAVTRRWKVLGLGLLVLGAHSLALSMYFIFPRYMTTTTILLGLLLGAGVGTVLRTPSALVRWYVIGVCCVYLLVMGRASAHAFRLEFQWQHYDRWVAVAEDLGSYLKPGERFMAQGSSVIAQHMGIYDRNQFMETPYAELDEIARLCEKENIRLVIASDRLRPHWPISDVVKHADQLQPPWRMVREWTFDESPGVTTAERMVLLEYRAQNDTILIGD